MIQLLFIKIKKLKDQINKQQKELDDLRRENFRLNFRYEKLKKIQNREVEQCSKIPIIPINFNTTVHQDCSDLSYRGRQFKMPTNRTVEIDMRFHLLNEADYQLLISLFQNGLTYMDGNSREIFFTIDGR